MTSPDVLVIGGGVIGCAVARLLAKDGRSVMVAERGAIGGEATTAAAGVLSVDSSTAEGDALAFRRASLAEHHALAPGLLEQTGIDVGLVVTGVLELCLHDGETRHGEWIDAKALRDVEPLASPTARGAWRYPNDPCVSTERLVAALAASARAYGAHVMPGHAVRAAERTGDRIARVEVGGSWITPGSVVLAAGAWSARIPDVPAGTPVAPARGQMFAVRPGARTCRHVLQHGDACLVPSRSGELLVGSLVEDAGFTKAVTGTGMATLLAHLNDIAPEARTLPITRMWSGLRPFREGGPFIDRHPQLENVVVATGHHRNGILLAPITASCVKSILDGVPPAVPVPSVQLDE